MKATLGSCLVSLSVETSQAPRRSSPPRPGARRRPRSSTSERTARFAAPRFFKISDASKRGNINTHAMLVLDATKTCCLRETARGALLELHARDQIQRVSQLHSGEDGAARSPGAASASGPARGASFFFVPRQIWCSRGVK